MEGNGSCREIPTAEKNVHLVNKAYEELDKSCLEGILYLTSLIPTGETDSNESKVLPLFILIDLNIIQLKSLLHHLEHDIQNSSKTLVIWEGQIKFYHDWVEALRVRQSGLAKKKSTCDIA